jgi:thioredoxin
MKISVFFKSFILLVLFSGCNQFSNGQKAQVLSAAEFGKQLAAKKDAQLLDVRTAGEFGEKHLDKAINIDYNGSSFSKQIEHLDKSKPVFVYCLSGGRSARASELLAQKGFKEVYNMEGGILAWTAAGKPVVSAEVSASGLSMDAYLAKVKSDKLVLVDFNAVWCGPCKILKPIVEKIAAEQKDKMTLLELDVDQNSSLSNEMHIKGIPLLVLYKQGKEVWRSLGLVDKPAIEEQVKKFSK